MRSLHVIPSVSQIRGGTSQAVLDMVKALRAKNIDAEIATTNDNGDSILNVSLQERIQYHQVPIWFFNRFSPSVKFLSEYAVSSDLTQWLWYNISNYDIVHIHAIFSYAPTITMLIAQLKNIPYIVTPHGLLCKWSLQQSTLKKQIYLKIIEQANLNYSQGLHFTSEQEEQEASQLHLTSPSFILPHGIYIPPTIPDARQRLRQHFNLALDEPIILFLSRLHPKKGLNYLIPALSKLSHHRFTLILAGSGDPDYDNEIRSLVIDRGIQNRTYFTGFVQGEFKELLMQGADLFTLTSYSENFGLSVLEALAVGLPVLVTPGVALANIVAQQSIGYVTELDVDAIASTLQKALDYPQDAKNRGDRARQFILENYTWDRVGTKMLSVYKNIVKSEPISALSHHQI
ncbi:glycosyltransferase [Calothrix membranacea FACHB-236]|nr:glycosyltransferase [Calothrix membranacea FACHB-236]